MSGRCQSQLVSLFNDVGQNVSTVQIWRSSVGRGQLKKIGQGQSLQVPPFNSVEGGGNISLV